MTPSRALALIEFVHGNEAKAAFAALNYSRFKYAPLKLEWAPMKVLSGEAAGAVAARTGEPPSDPTAASSTSKNTAPAGDDVKTNKSSADGEEVVGGKRKANPKVEDAVS